jgi:hypothetical protein
MMATKPFAVRSSRARIKRLLSVAIDTCIHLSTP